MAKNVINMQNSLKLKYGCWGQIGETNIPGFGHPVDRIDKNYQIWRRCRRLD